VRGGVAKSWLVSFSEDDVDGEGNSDGVKRGERKGEKVLCRARSEGTSWSRLVSGSNRGSWKLAISSAWRLLLRVEGAMVFEDPRGGLQNDTL
jgi:hypothetical protein